MGSDYNVKEHYHGDNKKVKKMIKIWESMTYMEQLEIFIELDEWNHHGT